MRIVIDMQGAQTASRYRGIGRYTLSFVEAVLRNKGEHEIILALSGLFPHTIAPIRQAFAGMLPAENIQVWYAPAGVHELDATNAPRLSIAEAIRESFLASLQPDVLHITSLFEGYVDDAVTHINRLHETTAISCMLYDLIPLLNPKQYLDANPSYKKHYIRKLKSLRKTSRYLAISEFARQEGLEQLQVESRCIVNVSTAIENNFRPLSLSQTQLEQLDKRFGISRPFILYTGGTDERKNLPRLIKAYAALEPELRQAHQLVFVGKVAENIRYELQAVAKSSGLVPEALCFAGYVTDEELVQLYNAARLFVFPSWHEGFGLPALEAMACGTPVIGANTSSLPEVIAYPEALFDPFDVQAMSTKMAQALTDSAFTDALRAHGFEQAKQFSWDKTAQRALAVWAEMGQEATSALAVEVSALKKSESKPKLAFVSPLPPERTGIADYSAELLPALAQYYQIYIITEQQEVVEPWVQAQGQIHDGNWLRKHAHEMDRVLYQVGNSPFHAYMLALMQEVPGTVVLHDFFLSGLMGWMEDIAGVPAAWVQALYESHGYQAVQQRFDSAAQAKYQYPVNMQVLRAAQGLIVHSDYSCQLAEQWYGAGASRGWSKIPLLRVAANPELSRAKAREQLGLADDAFVICSFGFLDATKLNQRLLEAWLASDLAVDPQCLLIFVGENEQGEYGVTLLKTIHKHKLTERVRITGFMPAEAFKQYLAAADIGVQLRTQSRGETSAAVLDCMNFGLPLVVNANGSMAELDSEAVCLLPDEFTDEALTAVLEELWHSPEKRELLSQRAQAVIATQHAPAACAEQYAQAIERAYQQASFATPALIQAIAAYLPSNTADQTLIELSGNIAVSLPVKQPAKRLFLDITATSSHDLKTGIERVTRAMLLALMAQPPAGYRIEPVYLNQKQGQWVYSYARQYTFGLLECAVEASVFADDIVDFQSADLLLGLDISGGRFIEAAAQGLFSGLRNRGVRCHFMLYDLLPIQFPEVFPPGAEAIHQHWLEAVATLDGVVAISKTVAADFSTWRTAQGLGQDEAGQKLPYSIDWVHLGADVSHSAPSTGLAKDTPQVLAQLAQRPTFLLVGTIEPRKGYLQAIEACTELWQQGVEINLVIVGREGWQSLAAEMRRDIPQTVTTLKHHPELGQRLFWLDGISDEYLEKIYAASTCLIAASKGEGFGLPLIEAAQQQIPILARDIPVFREVAGEHAFYFNGFEPSDLAAALKEWLALYEQGQHPRSDAMPWLTWAESARQLASKVVSAP